MSVIVKRELLATRWSLRKTIAQTAVSAELIENSRLARELLLNDDIEPVDFRAVKMEADREITVLEAKISDLRTSTTSIGEVEKTLDSALKTLTAIDKVYCESDHYGKRKLIGSIYPEKGS